MKQSALAVALFALGGLGELFLPSYAMPAQTQEQRNLEEEVDKLVEWRNSGIAIEQGGLSAGSIYDQNTLNEMWKNPPIINFNKLMVLYASETGYQIYKDFAIDKVISRPESFDVHIMKIPDRKDTRSLSTSSYAVLVPSTKKKIKFFVNGEYEKTAYYRPCRECSEIFDGVQIKAESDKKQYSLNEKLVLNYEIRNDGKEDKLIIYDKSPHPHALSASYLLLEILNPENHIVSYGPPIFGGVFNPMPAYIVLKSSEPLKGSIAFDLNPEAFYPSLSPGKYTMNLTFRSYDRGWYNDKAKGLPNGIEVFSDRLESNPIKFEIIEQNF